MADVYGSTVVVKRTGLSQAARNLQSILSSGDMTRAKAYLPFFIAQISNVWRSMDWAKRNAPMQSMIDVNTVAPDKVALVLARAQRLRKAAAEDDTEAAEELTESLEVLL